MVIFSSFTFLGLRYLIINDIFSYDNEDYENDKDSALCAFDGNVGIM